MHFKQIYALQGKWTKNDRDQKIILTSVSKGKNACRKNCTCQLISWFTKYSKNNESLNKFGNYAALNYGLL